MEKTPTSILVKDRQLLLRPGSFYQLNNNKFIFFEEKNFIKGNSDDLINSVKVFLKKFPLLFKIIFYLVGVVFIGKNSRDAIELVGKDKIILNLGSGAKKIDSQVIDVDFYAFDNVDVVADISNLPFADDSIDLIINEYVLEHVPNPQTIVKEMERVLKPGGILYVVVPFVASFHSSPNDYYRWSKQGFKELLKDFKEIESGVRSGPTSALVYVLSEWFGTLLSFGISKLQQLLFMFFMLLLSPLKLLDFILFPFIKTSENIAYGFYFIAKKE